MPMYKLTFVDDTDPTNTTERIVPVEEIGNIVTKAKKDQFTLIANVAVDTDKKEAEKANASQRSNPYEKDSLSAFGRGALQGVTLGFSDEMSLSEREKERARAKNLLAEEGSPVAYNIGKWIGSIPTDLGITKGVATVGAKLAPKLVMAGYPTLAQTVGSLATNPAVQAATAGAVSGGIQGAGEAGADESTFEEAGKGVLLGGASGLLGNWVSKKLVGDVGAEAAEKAAKSLNKSTATATVSAELGQKLKQEALKAAQQNFDFTRDAVDRLKKSGASKEVLSNLERELGDVENQLQMYKLTGKLNLTTDTKDFLNKQIESTANSLLAGGRSIYDESGKLLTGKEALAYAKEVAKEVVNKDLLADDAVERIISKRLKNMQERLANLPLKPSQVVATSGAKVAGGVISKNIQMPQSEGLPSPRDFIKQLEEEQLREALRLAYEEEQE